MVVEICSTTQPLHKIALLSSPYLPNDLDYDLFPINDTSGFVTNQIRPSPTGSLQSPQITVKGVARDLIERRVWVATGTTGVVGGVIKASPHFIQIANGRTLQQVWAVRLDRETLAGDSGAWVVDAVTGELCGHVVAGDPLTGLGYLVPAVKVFADIEARLGVAPVFPTLRNQSSSCVVHDKQHRISKIANPLKAYKRDNLKRLVLNTYEACSALASTPKHILENNGTVFKTVLRNLILCLVLALACFLQSNAKSTVTQNQVSGWEVFLVYAPVVGSILLVTFWREFYIYLLDSPRRSKVYREALDTFSLHRIIANEAARKIFQARSAIERELGISYVPTEVVKQRTFPRSGGEKRFSYRSYWRASIKKYDPTNLCRVLIQSITMNISLVLAFSRSKLRYLIWILSASYNAFLAFGKFCPSL